MHEVLQDERAFGISLTTKSPVWFSRKGGEFKLDVQDLPGLADKITGLLASNRNRRVRIVLDVLSSILALNSPESVYKVMDQLIGEVKEFDAVLLATLEDGMHSPQTHAAMEQLFDGVIEFSYQKYGLKILSLLRVAKMRGRTPRPEYYSFAFTQAGMELWSAEVDVEARRLPRLSGYPEAAHASSVPTYPFAGKETTAVFDYLIRSFIEDYSSNKLSIEQSGWRTRIAVAKATGVTPESFYGKEGRFGPTLKELMSSGLVETRFFSGQRGRGGEVTKIRIAYEKELVRRLVDASTRKRGEAER